MHRRKRCLIGLLSLACLSPGVVVASDSLDAYVNVTFDNVVSNEVNFVGVNQTLLEQELQLLADDGLNPLGYASLLNFTQSVQNGAVTVRGCPAGSYSDPGQTGCMLCGPGTYSTTELANNISTCIACPAGTWSGASGANSSGACQLCPRNTYSGTTGAVAVSTCLACVGNAESPPGTQSSAGCGCSGGYYTVGQTCVSCPEGSWCLGGIKTLCDVGSKAWSPAGSDAQGDCYCQAGYYGSTLSGGGGCQECWPGAYCPGGLNVSQAISCPESSTSPASASIITDCGCLSGYTENHWSNNERSFSTSAPACVCNNDNTCSNPPGITACPQFRFGDPTGTACVTGNANCQVQTQLSCPQGYVQFFSGNTKYLQDRIQEWVITPPGATQITLSFTTFATMQLDYVTVYSCDNQYCNSTFTQRAKLSGTPTALPADVTSTTGGMKITWSSISTGGSSSINGWQAQYSSQMSCTPLSYTLDGQAAALPLSSLVVWTGDTVTLTSENVNLRLTNTLDSNVQPVTDKYLTIFTASPGQYLVADTLAPTRSNTLVVLPLANQTLTLYVSTVSTGGYTMATVPGSPVQVPTGGNPTLYVTVGDTLVLARLTSGTPMVLCSSLTNNQCQQVTVDVVGQASTHITWQTSKAEPGVYYYAQYPGTPTGQVLYKGYIVLTARPDGLTCQICKSGEYCPTGVAVACPAHSASPEGSTAEGDCSCNAGYQMDTTNLQAYTNAQNADSGGSHSCAVTQGATAGETKLYCWGLNLNGQLGLGSVTVDSQSPQAVELPGVVSVSLGADFTCVLLSTGKVRCWGGNNYGQLAQGTSQTNSNAPNTINDSQLGSATYTASMLSCADYSCCAIVSDNSVQGVKCWGQNNFNQLGYSSTSFPTVGTTPGSLTSLNFLTFDVGVNVSSISVGGSTSCAIGSSTTGGTQVTKVYCWGSNSYGQLGRATGVSVSSPWTPGAVLLPTGVTPKIVNCYSGVCCAVTTSQQCLCWGDGANGRLGGGSTIPIGAAVGSMGNNLPAISVGANVLVLDVMVGSKMTCTLLSNNHVKCWGTINGTIWSDAVNELSDLLPNVQLQAGQQAIQLAGKGDTACAVTSEYALVCWGDNTYQQLGSPESNVPVDPATPGISTNLVLVPLGKDVVHSSGSPQSLTCSACPSNSYCIGGAQPAMTCGNLKFSPPLSPAASACKCQNGYYAGNNGVCTACQNTSYCTNNQASRCPANSGTLPGAYLFSNCTCLPGYTGGAADSCTACNTGTYKNVTGSMACTSCPAGTASNVAALGSSSGCGVCQAGYFSAPGATSCTQCQAGSASQAGAEVCTQCPAGTYAVQGASECTPCPAGTYFDSAGTSRDSCTACNAGRYSATVGATNVSFCQRCPGGWVAGQGSTECTQCGANTYSISGDAACSQCPLDSTSAPGANATGCTCAAGFFSEIDASSKNGFRCSVCPKGTWSQAGDASCSQCPAGTLQPITGATSASACTACPTGMSSSAGASVCSSCAAGTISVGGMCVSCQVGTWSSSSSTACNPCLAGRFNVGVGTSLSSCAICTQGYFCTGYANRTLCPLGSYSSSTGNREQDQCGTCSAGSYCPMPYLKASCPAYTTSPVGSTSQLQCTCMAGYQCTYTKIVEAVVSLSIDVASFQTAEVQAAFKQAIAAAAGGISPDMVYITKLVDTSSVAPPARRLLSMEDLASTPSPHSAKTVLHVFVGVVGSDSLHHLSERLNERSIVNLASAWYAPHHVDVNAGHR